MPKLYPPPEVSGCTNGTKAAHNRTNGTITKTGPRRALMGGRALIMSRTKAAKYPAKAANLSGGVVTQTTTANTRQMSLIRASTRPRNDETGTA
jgi:hypothetical protein